MKIPLKINNEKYVISAEPSEKLLSILRREKLYSVKCGCEEGRCGNCMVLLDDKPVPSCSIPIGIIRDSKITTLEEFKKTEIYQDIITGFNLAGITMCGYCNAGKIFTSYEILTEYYRPSIEQIQEALKGIDCCCTDKDTLINGILYAVATKHKREGRNNAKK